MGKKVIHLTNLMGNKGKEMKAKKKKKKPLKDKEEKGKILCWISMENFHEFECVTRIFKLELVLFWSKSFNLFLPEEGGRKIFQNFNILRS